VERRSAFWFVLFLVDFLGAFVELILNRHGSVRDHGADRSRRFWSRHSCPSQGREEEVMTLSLSLSLTHTHTLSVLCKYGVFLILCIFLDWLEFMNLFISGMF